jgi:hypothetical protein
VQVIQNILTFLLNNLQILIVVGIFGVSILSAIAKRLKEQADRRRAIQMREHAQREALRTGRVSTQATATAAPAQTEKDRRLAEIAARRQAQLEELRRRRALAQQQAQQQTQQQAAQRSQAQQQAVQRARAQQAARQQTPQRGSPRPRPARGGQTTAGPGAAQAQAQAQRAAQQRAAQLRALQQRAAQQARAAEPPVPSLSPPHPDHDDGVVHSIVASRAAPTDLSKPAPAMRVSGKSKGVPHGHALVGDVGELRRAFVLAEVLGPPVSLRTDAGR